jgi:hypothetical protein
MNQNTAEQCTECGTVGPVINANYASKCPFQLTFLSVHQNGNWK